MCTASKHSELTFSKHVKSVVRRCFYHTRQLRTVRKTLTTDSVKSLVHALIATRLDYCNSVFHQISAANLYALQSVLNAAARLVMRKRKYDHITATLRDDLHWLPIRQRVMYKLCTIVHKCLHAAAPPWLIFRLAKLLHKLKNLANTRLNTNNFS